MLTIGWHSGKFSNSPFLGEQVEGIPQAQLWLKNHLPWLKENSYGFHIWVTNSWDRGDKPAGDPDILISWYRDGSDCFGELFNPETGWRFYVTNRNTVKEEFIQRAD